MTYGSSQSRRFLVVFISTEMPNVLTKHDIQPAATKDPTRAELEMRAVNALCKDTLFLPGIQGWERKQQALAIVRVVLSAVLVFIAALLQPATARAETPDGAMLSTTIHNPFPHLCNDRDELAGVTNAEAGAQPDPAIKIAIMQIFVREAEQRGITFCALSHLTHFSSVRPYVRLHPDSYQARQLAYPPEELLQMADDVLHHRLEDVTGGMGHFVGDGVRIRLEP